MPNPITASEAMAKLKIAFPNDYVTVQVEITSCPISPGERIDHVEFNCYAAGYGSHKARTLETAFAMLMAKLEPAGDGAGEIDQINAAEATLPPHTVEEVAP
jgi:hypothetical protein